MAKRELKEKAIALRLLGKSYTDIKRVIPVSKSTLSAWLAGFPLTPDQLTDQHRNSIRVERCRDTKARKRREREVAMRARVRSDLAVLSERERFIAGLFLYWGEGTKVDPYIVSVANTDPSVIKFFLQWLQLMGVSVNDVEVRLQLYADMDTKDEISYWSGVLELPEHVFRKPYIKNSNRSGLTYKQRFSHGTCNVNYRNAGLGLYVQQAMEVLREQFIAPNTQI